MSKEERRVKEFERVPLVRILSQVKRDFIEVELEVPGCLITNLEISMTGLIETDKKGRVHFRPIAPYPDITGQAIDKITFSLKPKVEPSRIEPVEWVKGIDKKIADRLKRANVQSLRDLVKIPEEKLAKIAEISIDEARKFKKEALSYISEK